MLCRNAVYGIIIHGLDCTQKVQAYNYHPINLLFGRLKFKSCLLTRPSLHLQSMLVSLLLMSGSVLQSGERERFMPVLVSQRQ